MNATNSKLYQAAEALFDNKVRKDNAESWEWIAGGKPQPDFLRTDKLQQWAFDRWGVDLSKDHATVPPL